MSSALSFLVCLCAVWPVAGRAQVEVVAGERPVSLFSGEGRSLLVSFHNPAHTSVTSEVRMRVFQASSATAAPLADLLWKRLQVLPGQTVLESVRLDLPVVRAETRFIIQWITESNRVVGTSELLVYPTNLLRELKPLLIDDDLGVFDPHNRLKASLKTAGIEFVDLQEAGLDRFVGKLALIGPFESKDEMPRTLPASLKALARKGAGIVWIQPPRSKHDVLQPSFYSLPGVSTAIVVVAAELLENFSQNPQAQRALVQLAALAVRPEPPHLPDPSL